MKRANLGLFEDTLKKNKLFVFTAIDLSRLFGWSKTSIRFLLHRYTKRGITRRLKRGLYALASTYVPEAYVANRLYEPSYVSLETALSLHGVIPETVYGVTSITTKARRRFTVDRRDYSYHRIKIKAFTGYAPFAQGDFTCLLADPEKAFVDYYYLVVRGNRQRLDMERVRLDVLRPHIVEEYAELFGDARLTILLRGIFDKPTRPV